MPIGHETVLREVGTTQALINRTCKFQATFGGLDDANKNKQTGTSYGN